MTILEEPILKTIERLESRGSTGILELHDSEDREKCHVYFYDGAVEAVSSTMEESRLGQYLLREKAVDAEGLKRLLKRAQKQGVPIGQLLVDEKVVEIAELTVLLTWQLTDLIEMAIKRGFVVGAFTGSTKGSMKYRLQFTSFQIALELVRRRPVRVKVPPAQALILKPDVEVKPTGWTPEEVSILTHLRQGRTVAELVEATALTEGQVLAVLQVFLELGMLGVADRSLSRETSLVLRGRLPLENLVPMVTNFVFTEKIDVVNQEHSLVNEQFRALKVRLQSQSDPPVRILSITSALPQDGKSLISANLAMNYAREPGRRVLLIDADLRGASTHEKLGISIGPGLHQYLLGGLEPHCYIRRIGNLYVMTAGDNAENAVELLSLSRMQDLLQFAREEFDTVIVDAPPVIPIADARVIIGLTEATALVVYQGKTPYRMVRKAIEIINRNKLVGVILNGVKSTGVNGYYTYGHYYPYYSGVKKSKDGVIELKARPRISRGHRRSDGRVLFRDDE